MTVLPSLPIWAPEAGFRWSRHPSRGGGEAAKGDDAANHSLLAAWPPISNSLFKEEDQESTWAQSIMGTSEVGATLTNCLSGAEANLPEARAHILLAQLPHLIQERGFQTEECSCTRSSLFPRQDDLSGILKVTSL